MFIRLLEEYKKTFGIDAEDLVSVDLMSENKCITISEYIKILNKYNKVDRLWEFLTFDFKGESKQDILLNFGGFHFSVLRDCLLDYNEDINRLIRYKNA